MFVNNNLKNKFTNNNYNMTAQSKTAILDSRCTSQFVTKMLPATSPKITKHPSRYE
jgi:hypothetical protein